MESFRALAALAEPPSREHEAIAASLGLGSPPAPAEYSDLFVLQLYPFASVYLGVEGMIGGEARDRIAGFWRALSLEPPEEPDHLTVLLAFYAELAERAAAANGIEPAVGGGKFGRARRAYLWEHMLSWLPPFLLRLDAVAGAFHRAWGAMLTDALALEATAIGPLPERPLQLRQELQIEDPRNTGADLFLRSLLTPARSGLIFLRSDLERAAAELDLAARKGERKFVLRALLGQDAARTLDWLAREANAQAVAVEALPAVFATTTYVWVRRAKRTQLLLAELAAEA